MRRNPPTHAVRFFSDDVCCGQVRDLDLTWSTFNGYVERFAVSLVFGVATRRALSFLDVLALKSEFTTRACVMKSVSSVCQVHEMFSSQKRPEL